jgi:hypothetical protein
MRTLIDFSIMQEYNENVLTRGDRLSAISKLVKVIAGGLPQLS